MSVVGNLRTKLGLDNAAFMKGMQEAKGAAGRFAKVASNVGKVMAAVGVAAVAVGTKAAKAAAEYEKSRVSFEAFTGSAEKAKKLMDDLDKFNLKTPFETRDVRDAATQLLAFGITAEKVVPTMEVLGNLSQGNTAKMKSLALAFGQAKAEGRVMTKDLRQFINAGVPMVDLLQRSIGDLNANIFEMASNGEISFEMVEDAMVKATSEGGQFFNLMINQSKTLGGLWSNLSDATDIFFRKVGQYLLPTLKVASNDLLNIMNDVLGKMDEMGENDGPQRLAIQFKLITETTRLGFQVMFNRITQYLNDFIAKTYGVIGGMMSFLKLDPSNAFAAAGRHGVQADGFKGLADEAQMLLEILGAQKQAGNLASFFGIDQMTASGATGFSPGGGSGGGGGGPTHGGGVGSLRKLNGGGLGTLSKDALAEIAQGLVLVNTAFTDFADQVAEVTPDLNENLEGMTMLLSGLKEVGQEVATTIGDAMYDMAMQGEDSFKRLGQAAIAAAAKVVRAKLMEAVAAQLANIFKSVPFPFNIAIAAAGGAAVGVLFNKLVNKVTGMTKFAKGGIVTSPTMGLVGEYPSAPTDPEVIGRASTIANVVDKFMGRNGGQELVAKVRGSELLFLLRQASFDNAAKGGPAIQFV